MDSVQVLPFLRALAFSFFTVAGILIATVAYFGWIHPVVGVILIVAVLAYGAVTRYRRMKAIEEGRQWDEAHGLADYPKEPGKS